MYQNELLVTVSQIHIPRPDKTTDRRLVGKNGGSYWANYPEMCFFNYVIIYIYLVHRGRSQDICVSIRHLQFKANMSSWAIFQICYLKRHYFRYTFNLESEICSDFL
jgi:hypothetical protein